MEKSRDIQQSREDIDKLYPLKLDSAKEYDCDNREVFEIGSFEEVFKVLHIPSQTFVALKRFLVSLNGENQIDTENKAERELVILKSLANHPLILKL